MNMSSWERSQFERDVKEVHGTYDKEIRYAIKSDPASNPNWNPIFKEVTDDHGLVVRKFPAAKYNDVTADQGRDMSPHGMKNTGRILCCISTADLVGIDPTALIMYMHQPDVLYQIGDIREADGEHRLRIYKYDGDDDMLELVRNAVITE